MKLSLLIVDSRAALENFYTIDHYHMEKAFFSFTPLCPICYKDALCLYNKYLPLISGEIHSNDGELIGFKVWRKIISEHYHCMIEIIKRSHRKKGFSRLLSFSMKETVFPNVKYLTKTVMPENSSIECEPKTFLPLHRDNIISTEELNLIKNLNSSYNSRIIKNFYQTLGGHGYIKSYKID